MAEQRSVKGRNLRGQKRDYTFNLLSAKVAFQEFHKFANKEMQLAAPVVVEQLGKLRDADDPSLVDGDLVNNLPDKALGLAQMLPIIFDLDRICELNQLMLRGATVDTGEGKVVEFDGTGFAEIDPLEMYVALLYAIAANYESMLAPLLAALVEQGDDTSQPSGQAEKE